MDTEVRSFGRSCLILPRRFFVMGFCGLMWVMCTLQIIKWICFAPVWQQIMGNGVTPVQQECEGAQCFETMTCYGMRSASASVREPLMSLTGFFFYLWGTLGAWRTVKRDLVWLSYYAMLASMLHIGLLIWDIGYKTSCGAYPENAIRQTMLQRFPPPPFGPGMVHMLKDELRVTAWFPEEMIDALSAKNEFAWYITWAAIWTLLLAYLSRESAKLAVLMERGPLGLGIHYGLNAWGDMIRDAQLKHKLYGKPNAQPEGNGGYGTLGMEEGRSYELSGAEVPAPVQEVPFPDKDIYEGPPP